MDTSTPPVLLVGKKEARPSIRKGIAERITRNSTQFYGLATPTQDDLDEGNVKSLKGSQPAEQTKDESKREIQDQDGTRSTPEKDELNAVYQTQGSGDAPQSPSSPDCEKIIDGMLRDSIQTHDIELD